MTDAHHRLSLANKITILRILAVPLFVLALLYYTTDLQRGEPREMCRWTALVIFLAAALTDALDGYVARSRGEITRLGRVLDPLADKSLLLSGLILLTRPSLPQLEPHIPIWFTLLAISRDVLLLAGAALIHWFAGAVEVRPRLTGKAATVAQMVVVVWALVGGAPREFLFCVGVAGAATFASGILYLFDGVRQIERAAAAHHRQRHDVRPA